MINQLQMRRNDVKSTLVLAVRCSGANNGFCDWRAVLQTVSLSLYMQGCEVETRRKYKVQHLDIIKQAATLKSCLYCVSSEGGKWQLSLNKETTGRLSSILPFFFFFFSPHSCIDPCCSGITEFEHRSQIRPGASWIRRSHVYMCAWNQILSQNDETSKSSWYVASFIYLLSVNCHISKDKTNFYATNIRLFFFMTFP